jgi:hypothetical protein
LDVRWWAVERPEGSDVKTETWRKTNPVSLRGEGRSLVWESQASRHQVEKLTGEWGGEKWTDRPSDRK